MIDPVDAAQAASVLKEAGAAIRVPQVRAHLLGLAREWETAVAEADDECAVELAGSVVPGMLVSAPGGWANVRRSFGAQGGGWTLHVEDAERGDPRGHYVNLASQASPVVVER